MPICNKNEFLNNLEKKKIMCIDIGKKKCGIALSDPFNKFSLPHKVLRVSERKIYEELVNIIETYGINLIVVGLPLNDDNSLNKQCQSIIDRTKYLDKKFVELNKVLQIIFWDESYSTLEALSKISNKKKDLDHHAACIILQDFLDFSNKKNND